MPMDATFLRCDIFQWRFRRSAQHRPQSQLRDRFAKFCCRLTAELPILPGEMDQAQSQPSPTGQAYQLPSARPVPDLSFDAVNGDVSRDNRPIVGPLRSHGDFREPLPVPGLLEGQGCHAFALCSDRIRPTARRLTDPATTKPFPARHPIHDGRQRIRSTITSPLPLISRPSISLRRGPACHGAGASADLSTNSVPAITPAANLPAPEISTDWCADSRHPHFRSPARANVLYLVPRHGLVPHASSQPIPFTVVLKASH